MKASDKIYVHRTVHLGFLAASEINITGKDVEYVRKDSLLEWAKETYLNENASAIRKVCYKQLIDKLNSL